MISEDELKTALEAGYFDARSSAAQQLSGTVLTAALLATAASTYKGRSVVLDNVILAGTLDWSGREIDLGIQFRNCTFDRPIRATGATFAGDLQFLSCDLTRLELDEATVGRSLVISRITRRVPRSRVLRGTELSRARIGSSLVLIDSRFDHGIRLSAATIDGDALLNGARIERGSGDHALVADNLRLGRHLDLDDVWARGEVRALGAKISGELSMYGTRIFNPSGDAFSADGIQIDGRCGIGRGFSATGVVRMPSAQITGQLAVQGAYIEAPDRIAFNADRLTVLGDAMFEDMTVLGSTSLSGSKIDGTLSMSRVVLIKPDDCALQADGIRVDGAMLMCPGFEAVGEVRMLDAEIRGQLNLGGATLYNPGGAALSLDNAHIGSSLFLNRGAMASGLVRAIGLKVGSQLGLRGATLHNPGGVSLTAQHMTVAGDANLSHGFTATGTIDMFGATINGSLSLDTALLGGFPLALYAEGTVIVGRLDMTRLRLRPTGAVVFTKASVGRLNDDLDSWPSSDGTVAISGFAYEQMDQKALAISVEDRVDWIQRQGDYDPQPYVQLAALLRQIGHEDRAKRVLVAKHTDARRLTSQRPLSAARSVGHGLATGHGYYPLRLLAFVLCLYVASVVLVSATQQRGHFTAVSDMPSAASANSAVCTSEYPCLSRLIYPIDSVAPVINLHQAEYWQPDSENGWGLATRFWLVFATIAGWVMLTVIVVGVTGLVRRE